MRITMPLIVATASLCFTAFGTALAADEPPGGAPPQSATYVPEVTVANSEEVVCKDVKTLGSRVQSQKVCMTRGDWAIHERKAQDTVEQWQRTGAAQRGH